MRDTIHVQNCNISSLHLGIGEEYIQPDNPTKSTYRCYGGELHVLSGSKITSYDLTDSGRWGGAYVWGAMQHPNFYDYVENRGKAFMDNGTIEKAFIGINTARNRADLTNPIHPGGIVKAFESNILNCDRMVNLHGFPYQYLPPVGGGGGTVNTFNWYPNGEESFVKCNFKYTGTYVPYSNLIANPAASGYASLPTMFRILNGQGVNILGCKFENEYYYGVTYAQRKCRAIFATGSKFTVSNTYSYAIYVWPGPSSGTATSLFKNLYSGISVHGGAFQNVKIQNSLFDNVSFGVTIEDALHPIVSQNTFNLSNIDCGADRPGVYAFPEAAALGITTAYTTGYQINGNNIIGVNPNCNMGIGAYASGPVYNKINGNTLNKTKAALHGRRFNADITDNKIGLQFYCNGVLNNPEGVDIYGTQSHSVAAIQAFGADAAGNTFSNPKISNGYHIYIDPTGYNVDYRHNGAPNADPFVRSGNVTTNNGYTDKCNYVDEPIIIRPSTPITEIGIVEGEIFFLMGIPPGDRTPVQEAELTALMYQHNTLIDSFVLYYMYGDTSLMHQDSIIPHIDSVALLLSETNINYMHKIMLAAAMHTLGDIDSAIAVTDAIPSNFTLSTEEADRIANIKTMYGIYKAMAENGNHIDSLHVDDYTALINIRDNDDFRAAGMARTLWFAAHPEDLDSMQIGWPLPEFIDEDSDNQGRDRYAHSIIVYPSPAREIISFDYPTNNEASTYTISDIQGRALLSGKVNVGNNDISVSPLSAGIYILTINEGSRVTHRSKIAKQ